MIKNLNILPIPTLGGGYSTDMQMATIEPCLSISSSNVVYGSGDKSTINMGNSQTFQQIAGILGIYGDISLFSDDTASIFYGQIQDNLYSQTFHFYEQVVFPTQTFIPVAFGVNALNGLGQGNYNTSFEQFRAVCGDQFVQQIHYGANLFVSFQIVFASLSDKQTFNAAISSSGFAGLFDTSTSTQTIITQYNLAGTINLLAYQNGGNPSDLAQIFANNTNGYYITSCELSNLSVCQDSINGILGYAINSFSNQINITNGDITGNAAPIGYTYLPYTILGLNAASTIITPQITQARMNLTNVYETLQEQNIFVSHLTASWVVKYIQSNVLNNLQNILTSINYNIGLLEDQNSGAIACYTEPENCVATEQNLINSFVLINADFLSQFNTAFELNYLSACQNGNNYCYCPNIYPGSVFNGIAYPIGENNYVKTQVTGFVEQLQIIFENQNLYLNESNIGNGASGFAINMSYMADNAFYAQVSMGAGSCSVACTALTADVIDNPI